MFIREEQDLNLNEEFFLAVVCDVLYGCFGKSENFTNDGFFFACNI